MQSMNNSSFIIHEQARQYHWQGSGLLSIKSFSGGLARYDIGQGTFSVDDSSYLVLNHDQEYSIGIDSETPVISFCVFFANGFAESVHQTSIKNHEQLLDDFSGQSVQSSLFFQRTYKHDQVLSPILGYTREAYKNRKNESGWLNEQFHFIMERLLQVYNLTHREINLITAARASTREELYRRIHLARDFIIASYHQPIQLDDIASVASMSPNHLLRTFKQTFSQTPYQFLTDVRLNQARHLLASTDDTVTEICLKVGFESLGSFSWLFSRRFGMSPQVFRQLIR